MAGKTSKTGRLHLCITRNLDRTGFDCGDTALDECLAR